MKHGLVGRASQASRSPLDLYRSIDTRHHVDQHPGSVDGDRSNIGGHEFEGVDIELGMRKQLIHAATIGVFGSRVRWAVDNCGQLSRNPPTIHRKYTGLFLFQPTGMSRTVHPGAVLRRVRRTVVRRSVRSRLAGRLLGRDPRDPLYLALASQRTQPIELPRQDRFCGIVDTGGITLL